MAHIGNTGIILYNTVEVRLCKDNACHVVGSELCLKVGKVCNAILLSDSLNDYTLVLCVSLDNASYLWVDSC